MEGKILIRRKKQQKLKQTQNAAEYFEKHLFIVFDNLEFCKLAKILIWFLKLILFHKEQSFLSSAIYSYSNTF